MGKSSRRGSLLRVDWVSTLVTLVAVAARVAVIGPPCEARLGKSIGVLRGAACAHRDGISHDERDAGTLVRLYERFVGINEREVHSVARGCLPLLDAWWTPVGRPLDACWTPVGRLLDVVPASARSPRPDF
jgi:hypothetical protein